MFEDNNTQSWLYGTPPSDINFKGALQQATVEEMQEVLSALPVTGNKTKISMIQREIKKRKKEKSNDDGR